MFSPARRAQLSLLAVTTVFTSSIGILGLRAWQNQHPIPPATPRIAIPTPPTPPTMQPIKLADSRTRKS